MSIEHVLVVDDSSSMRGMVTKAARLCIPGAEFHEADDGKEAIAICKQVHIDLLLCDVNMPAMDGVEVVEYIREAEKNDHMYIIMITTEVSGDSIKRCVIAGADDYLTKPFTEDQLRAKIERIKTSTNRHSRLH